MKFSDKRMELHLRTRDNCIKRRCYCQKHTEFLLSSCNLSVIVIFAGGAFELQNKSKNPLSHSMMSFNGEIIALIRGSFSKYASSDKIEYMISLAFQNQLKPSLWLHLWLFMYLPHCYHCSQEEQVLVSRMIRSRDPDPDLEDPWRSLWRLQRWSCLELDWWHQYRNPQSPRDFVKHYCERRRLDKTILKHVPWF